MPIPMFVARLNRVATNRVTARFAGWMPGFGLVVHQGRRSGRRYRTPVNVFRVPGGYVIALTYGPDTDWVKNVVAGNGCVLETRRRRVRLVNPRIVPDESRHDLPPVVRRILGLIRVTDLLYLTEEPPTGRDAAASRRSAGLPPGVPEVQPAAGVQDGAPVEAASGADQAGDRQHHQDDREQHLREAREPSAPYRDQMRVAKSSA